mmetsp:Transcript_7259/g.29585  ORF Transcript_7259/g.29585 Transcript_7259/m.29585 type:complete len:229 (+) Transcript_7259:116-802(+)
MRGVRRALRPQGAGRVLPGGVRGASVRAARARGGAGAAAGAAHAARAARTAEQSVGRRGVAPAARARWRVAAATAARPLGLGRVRGLRRAPELRARRRGGRRIARSERALLEGAQGQRSRSHQRYSRCVLLFAPRRLLARAKGRVGVHRDHQHRRPRRQVAGRGRRPLHGARAARLRASPSVRDAWGAMLRQCAPNATGGRRSIDVCERVRVVVRDVRGAHATERLLF